jgi:hypothetical protein
MRWRQYLPSKYPLILTGFNFSKVLGKASRCDPIESFHNIDNSNMHIDINIQFDLRGDLENQI